MANPPLIHADFLLDTPAARELYHGHAAQLPIIDYHCHLPPRDVAEDRRFANLYRIWLEGDHYKWRAMRSAGVPEGLITGAESTDEEKYLAWAATVPKCLRNPLYHWTHLELNRPFGINDRLLGPDTAEGVWEHCNELLAQPGFSARGIMRRMNVAVVCTTDDPVDDLAHHAAIAADRSFATQVRPTWRPDKGMAIEEPAAFNAWLAKLETASGVTIHTMDDYRAALAKRHDHFHQRGCRLSDHGLETVWADDWSEQGIAAIFKKVRAGGVPTPEESAQFRSCMLHEWAVMDHAKGWVQQFHLGPIRNNSTRMFKALGPDTGFDSIGDASYAKPLSRMLDRLDRGDQLARTILYNINPKENEVLGTMIGNFQGGGIAGKMQFGSGWWFLDQMDGMEKQLDALSNLGLLSTFVGMLTDSRSFLSYTRHEYFRRILCRRLGREIAGGLLPNDLALVGGLVRDVCYRNAARYFGFGVPVEG
jgi:glucuronate isomerase